MSPCGISPSGTSPNVPTPGPNAPEQRARQQIDAALTAAGWAVQNRETVAFSRSLGLFVGVMLVMLFVSAYRIYFRQMLEMRWRRWLSDH